MNNGPAYYNEFDPAAAEWLRQLIADGLITPGVVDGRSIVDVQPADLAGFRRVHFFAGIGLWDHALNLAGWGDDEIWTGSCPCQPFSSAGKQQGTKDERHLWPEFMRLIRACRPRYVVGEQVASTPVLGSAGKRGAPDAGPVWLDGVFADLEAAHYTCGALDLPAAGVGAPHIRQRLWWGGFDRLADANGPRHPDAGPGQGDDGDRACENAHGGERLSKSADGGGTRRLADAATSGRQGHCAEPGLDGATPEPGERIKQSQRLGSARGLADTESQREDPERRGSREGLLDRDGCGSARGMEHAVEPGLEGHAGHEHDRDEPGRLGAQPAGPAPEAGGAGGVGDAATVGCEVRKYIHGELRGQGLGQGRESGPWSDFALVYCTDGKVRRIPAESEPVFLRMADGDSSAVDLLGDEGRRVAEAAKGYPLALKVPHRTALLRGVGNAIVPEVAAVFLRAFRRVVNPL